VRVPIGSKLAVEANNNDAIDAAAIAEAVTRPSMRFVAVKRVEQVELQALHRIRDQMVTNRTRFDRSGKSILP
jgi:transposase